MKRIALAMMLLLFCILYGCKDDGTGPPPGPKNPREYRWTVDTLAYPGSFQTNMTDIWASSPKDVYVVGHNDQNRGLMWHYDGQRWTDVKLSTTQGGTIVGSIDLVAIYGFAPNDVWAVGERIYDNPNPAPTFLDSSLIIHFDGTQWREQRAPGGRLLQSVWGSSPSDVWAGGWNSLFHFDGTSWAAIPFPRVPEVVQFLRISGTTSTDVFMIGAFTMHPSLNASGFYLYYFDGTQWSVVDSVIRLPGMGPEKFGRELFSIEGQLYSAEYGVFKKTGTGWETLLLSSVPFGGLGGSSSSNLFAVGMDTQVRNYNGNDWYRYPQFNDPGFVLVGVWTDGTEAFAVGNNGNKTIILHGK